MLEPTASARVVKDHFPVAISEQIMEDQFMPTILQDSVVTAQQHSVTELCKYLWMSETLGDRVRAARSDIGLSRVELARATKIGYSTIAEIENGGMKSSTKIHVLASALGVSDEWLATGRGNRSRTGATDAAYKPTEPADPALHSSVRESRWVTSSPAHERLQQALDHAAASGALSQQAADALATVVESLSESKPKPRKSDYRKLLKHD